MFSVAVRLAGHSIIIEGVFLNTHKRKCNTSGLMSNDKSKLFFG